MGNRGKEDVAWRFSEQVITAMWLELIDGILAKEPATAIEGRLFLGLVRSRGCHGTLLGASRGENVDIFD